MRNPHLNLELAARAKEVLKGHEHPPVDRWQLGTWLWPGSNYNLARRTQQVIHMTQVHRELLNGCISYSPAVGAYVWVDRNEDWEGSSWELAHRSVTYGSLRMLNNAAVPIGVLAFVIRAWGNQSKQDQAFKEISIELADTLDYTEKAIRSAINKLKRAS